MNHEPTSTKPYLLRALHEWCVDNGYTPYVAVAVDRNTRVPREHVKDGEIVLNIGPLATNKLRIGNDEIEFQARFGGVARELYVPMSAVKAIYARETGHGMQFDYASPVAEVDPAVEDPAVGSPADEPAPAPPAGSGGRPSLRRVK